MQTQDLTMIWQPAVNPALALDASRDGTDGGAAAARGVNRPADDASLWAYAQSTVPGDRWENRVWLALAAMAAIELALVLFRA